MPARRSTLQPAKAVDAKGDLAALGFRLADSGPQTWKTLMLQELEALLAAVPAEAPVTAIAERTGASGEIGAELLNLQQQLFEQWYRWKDGAIDRHQLRQGCWPLRVAFEQVLHRAVELGCQPREQTLWAKTVRTFLESVAPCGDPTEDQPWRPIQQGCALPQPPAHRDHQPETTGPRCK